MTGGSDQEFQPPSEAPAPPSEAPQPAYEHADWWYVGQYGELGPLTLSQMQGLAEDRVIDAQTYVWQEGMADWVPASSRSELRAASDGPPPMPARPSGPPPTPTTPASQLSPSGFASFSAPAASMAQHQASYPVGIPVSDKSRLVAGLLNILPGFGRFYLGYSAHGLLQFFTGWCLGVGFIWSFVDGLYILMGGLKFDGFGRRLDD